MDFPEYRRITLDDIENFDNYRISFVNSLTALSFPSLYTWAESLDLRIYKDSRVFSVYSGSNNGYFCPMGDKERCLELIDCLVANKKNIKFMYLSREQAEFLEKQKGARIRMNRDLSEYIYNSAALAFKEKPSVNFRRRVRDFQHKYDYTVEPVRPGDVLELTEFVKSMSADDDKYFDVDVMNKALTSFATLGMTGVILRGSGHFAFLLGYRNTDNIFTMTTTRADTEWHSISVSVCEHEMASLICSEYEYIDLEEDLGLSGLRRIKELTGPVTMLEAWEAYFGIAELDE